ncbi:MAG: response regulator [Gammaproteobacteria bacterium]|nr:response regulator [Gammaproteobacteria bacterium]
MATGSDGHTQRWISYAVTFVSGFAFGVVLFLIVSNNALEAKKKEFSYELSSLKETIFHNILVSNDIINNLTAYIIANPELTGQQFNLFSQELLSFHPFIDAVIYYPLVRENEIDDFNKRLNEYTGTDNHNLVFDIERGEENPEYYLPVLYQASRHENILPPGHDVNTDNNFQTIIRSIFMSDSSTPISSVITTGNTSRFGLFKVLLNDGYSSLQGQDTVAAMKGIISIIADPEKIIGQSAVTDDMALTLYNESAGISGRQLLYKKEAKQTRSKRWAIAPIIEENLIQLPSYSIKLSIAKDIYWDDVEKGLIYTALIIGGGVTLLLIALVRAKELQARELRERNILIERTVKEQTKELAWARDKAVKASLMKSDFLASMSHEIRTPLNAIIGMSELLSETKLTDEQEKYINVFKRAGDTLLSLVNDILDLSKIEAHQLILEKISFNIIDVVEESVEIYALKAAEKKVELICRVDPAINVNRIGDPARLRQVILNLISNSLKFTEQGEIVVYVSHGKENNNDHVLFSVTDSGIGIPNEKLESIFESFTQADSSITRKYGGTGLGLTISKSLVELMHGKIWVTSEVGKGSIFSFIVHLLVDSVSAQKPVVANYKLDGKNILVVDDNETNRILLNEILCSKGAKVTVAEDGNSALQFLQSVDTRNKGFQLAIIDCYLPDMDGFQLVEAMKVRDQKINTAMMINPADLNTHMVRIKAIGINSYLVKPVKQLELLDMVSNSLFGKETSLKPDSVIQDADVKGTVRRLLLVDDNPDNRMLIKAYLKKTSYEIDEAENGEIAVGMFQQGHYDLVLMDVQMPVMDGHKATRMVRAWETEKHKSATPVIALTAHATREEVNKCLSAGCTSHLAKPIKKSLLMDMLQNYLPG